MSLIAWNYRCIGGGPTVRPLKLLQRKHNLGIIFLSEIIGEQRCEQVGRRCGLQGICCMKSTKKSVWAMPIVASKVHILHRSTFMIHIKIRHPIFPKDWLLTCIYGPPYSHLKQHFWKILNDMANIISEPWVLVED